LNLYGILIYSVAQTELWKLRVHQRFEKVLDMSTHKKHKHAKRDALRELYGDNTPAVGNSLSQRGKPKYLGGNGRKTTGITKRYFRKNMQRVRLVENGVTVRRWVPVSMIRAGLIQKPVVREPFTLPELEGDS